MDLITDKNLISTLFKEQNNLSSRQGGNTYPYETLLPYGSIASDALQEYGNKVGFLPPSLRY
jgi:hypothetical protein